jgi:Ion transport protein
MIDKFKVKYISKHKAFEYFMLVVAIANTAIVILIFADFDSHVDSILDTCNNAILAFYIFEALVKLIGLGIIKYFEDSWNKLDFGILMISFLTDYAFTIVRVLRTTRALKSTRLIKFVSTAKISNKNFWAKILRVLQKIL